MGLLNNSISQIAIAQTSITKVLIKLTSPFRNRIAIILNNSSYLIILRLLKNRSSNKSTTQILIKGYMFKQEIRTMVVAVLVVLSRTTIFLYPSNNISNSSNSIIKINNSKYLYPNNKNMSHHHQISISTNISHNFYNKMNSNSNSLLYYNRIMILSKGIAALAVTQF